MARRLEQRASNRQAIIEAAARLFLRTGYASASMEQVAAEAGVAKQTVYNHFSGKEALFQAILDELIQQLADALPTAGRPATDIRTNLLSFARRFLSLMVAPESLGLHRILVAEGPRFPEFVRTVFAAGPQQTTQRLARYLRAEAEAGTIDVDDADLAAEQLLGALRGNIQLRLLFMAGAPPSAAELERMAAAAVASFLRAHQRQPAASRVAAHG